MIERLLILVDNKLITNKFTINRKNNKIIISLLENINNNVMIPVYNKFNGIDYIPVKFPLELIIINDMELFNPYIILSSYNINMVDIDFFYNISIIIKSKYNMKFINFSDFINNNPDQFIKIMNENYNDILTLPLTIESIETYTSSLLFSLNIIKLYIMYILIKFPNICNKNLKELHQKYNIPKKILSMCNHLKLIKYKLTDAVEYMLSLNEYILNIDNLCSPLKLSDIKQNSSYYIVIKKSNMESSITSHIDKAIRIKILGITKNMITINSTKNILFENYLWYGYHPNININRDYVYYMTYINMNFYNEIIKEFICVEDIHSMKIIEYYYIDNKTSNLLVLTNIIETKEFFEDMNILKSKSFSDSYFEYITKKYSTNMYDNNNKLVDILTILFDNYNYPLKPNRHELDGTFDHILYISLYNYKHIFINNVVEPSSLLSFAKNKTNIKTKIVYTELLHPNINAIIPIKLKNLYMNILKTLNQIINNDFESITYNHKFYYDFLHKHIIKLFLLDNVVKPQLSINLFKSLSIATYDKFKDIVLTNFILIDIIGKLNWTNLPKKLPYLNFFYKNPNLVHYMDKLNKNIFPDNFDIRIKKVIENPFEMYKYLRKEKDFIRWTKFISNQIILLYVVPISLSSDDFELIGKLIYLLFNIIEQNMKDSSYMQFINFCNLNNKLILESSRINLKIKEFFPNLKSNINLGFLAKHLTWHSDIITFEEAGEKSPEIIHLETKLLLATKKYYKYKIKYIGTKNNNVKINDSITSDMTIVSKSLYLQTNIISEMIPTEINL